MKKLIEKIQEIWSIPDLRNRISLTVLFLLVYRLGSKIFLPGFDMGELDKLRQAKGSGGNILDLLNTFTGGAFYSAAVFALGIMPYISASIIVQLAGFAIPYFQKLQKDGENGQRQLNQITRFITIAITVVQGSFYLAYMKSEYASAIIVGDSIFWFSNIIILTSGTVFCMWLGEKITDKGIGNGISLLITAGIIAALPSAFYKEFTIASKNPFLFVIELFLLLGVFMASVALVQAVRKIKIQCAHHIAGGAQEGLTEEESIVNGGERDYLPIKLNAAGVMPIIFAQALMFAPAAIAGAMGATGQIWKDLGDFKTLPYNILFFVLIVVFTYVYTALIVNPQQYADHLKRQNAYIPGVKQGTDTAEYIDAVTSRVTLPGSIGLGIISIFPGIVAGTQITKDASFAIFFGGTSLLILVSVVLDTLQQIEGHVLMKRYDSVSETDSIRGRNSEYSEEITA